MKKRAALTMAAVLGASAATAAIPDAVTRDWTMCMTALAPAATIIAHCTRVLGRSDISNFHRALLVAARADAEVRLGRDRAAVADYGRAIALDPTADDLYASRGVAEENLGRLKSAEADYDQAIARYLAQPNNRTNGTLDVLANDYALRGRVRLAMGRPDAALSDLNLAVTTYPQGTSLELKRLVSKARRAVKSGRLARR